jgi:hypothetical protein
MPDQLSAPQTIPPANAPMDTQRLLLDSSPLRRSNPWDAHRRTVEWKQVDADCLVLVPKQWAAFWHVPLLVAGAVGPSTGLVYLLLEMIQGNASLISVLIVVLGLLLMLALLLLGILAPAGCHRWVRFDRRTGLMTISQRPLGFRRSLQVVRTRPLTDILCVQLLYAGWQSENVEIGEPGTPGSVIHQSYPLYQLNLVVEDREEPRFNLSSHADVKWMRQASRLLADFLRVPLIDQLLQGH